MAATALILGILREVWRETVAQGSGPPATVTTGIRCEQRSLSKVRAQLVIDSIAGAPAPSVTAQVSATGFLEFLVFTGGAGATMTWTLDAQLTHSVQQGNDRVHGAYVSIVNSAAVGGGIASQTLAQTYAIGVVSADQTMVIDTANHGAGIIVDASTAAVTADGPALDIRQNATWVAPLAVRRAGNDNTSPLVQFEKSRGTFAVPAGIIGDDILGTIDFNAYLGGAFGTVTGARIAAPVRVLDEGGIQTALDYYLSEADTPVHAWRMTFIPNSVVGQMIGYGIENSNLAATVDLWKARGTEAAPVIVQANDLLGELRTYGYGNAWDLCTSIVSVVTNVGAGPAFNLTAAIDIYAVAAGSYNQCLRISSGEVRFYNDAYLNPDVTDQGTIGNPVGRSWHWVSAYTYFALEAVMVGDYTGPAHHTISLGNTSTMPAPTANKTYVGCVDFGFGATHATVALSAEELAVALTVETADTLIPIVFNGVSYYLLAFTPT